MPRASETRLARAEAELRDALEERDALQPLLDQTEGWDDVDPDDVKDFIQGTDLDERED